MQLAADAAGAISADAFDIVLADATPENLDALTSATIPTPAAGMVFRRCWRLRRAWRRNSPHFSPTTDGH